MMDREREVREADVAEERNPVRRGMIFNREAPVREAVGAEARGVLERYTVRFGPIWAGVLVGLTALLILGSLATSLGLYALPNVAPMGGFSPTVTGLVASFVAFISLFVGGYACGYLLNDPRHRFGILHGLLVGCLSLIGTAVLSGLGATGLMSHILRIANIAPAAAGGVTASEAAQAAAGAAGWFTFAAIVLLIASTWGAKVGNDRACQETREGSRFVT